MAKGKSTVSADFEGGVEVQSNWFKFENVGDGVKGTLIKRYTQKATQPQFPDQLVCEIKKDDGTVWNVGISLNKQGTVARLNNVKIGEIIGILFDAEIPPTKKGFAPAKQLKILSFGMDPNWNEMSSGAEVNGYEVPEM